MVKAPEVSDSIAIAKSPRLTASGEFVTANIVDVDDLEEDATSWSPTRPLPVGTFYWHVGLDRHDPGLEREDVHGGGEADDPRRGRRAVRSSSSGRAASSSRR